MKDVLASGQRDRLARFAWSSTLVGLDFDGTLAPIVARPEDAELRPRTRELLAALARAYPVAVLSGRARDDVSARLRGIPLRAIIGNHGLEPSRALDRCRRVVTRWTPVLEAALASEPGVEIEDKTYSLAIHFRRARMRRAAHARILAAIARLDGPPRVVGGKLVVNVLPPGAPHKGIALLRLRDALRADTAIYVGDDVTDEDVFALDDPGRLLSIRVGAGRRSAAPFYLRSQAAIDELLETLVALRKRIGHRVRDGGLLPP